MGYEARIPAKFNQPPLLKSYRNPMKAIQKKKEIVIIWWEDAVIHNLTAQLDESEVKEHMPIQAISVGILADETKDHITISADNFPRMQKSEMMAFREEQYRQISTIPKACIKKMKRIKL